MSNKRILKAAAVLGKAGGKTRQAKIKAGLIPRTGGRQPQPTACTRCGDTQPSARAAWVHCRKPR